MGKDYNNIVIISADRSGSTAFQHNLLGPIFNNNTILWLGECFSQDSGKGQPPKWYNPKLYNPKQVIDIVNIGTGKSVLVKIQITYPNFSNDFLNISSKRKIFFHRNLFDSTLSRCIAQKTGKWLSLQEKQNVENIEISEEFFLSRLHWRIEQYMKHLDNVLEWSNEIYRYETYKYSKNLFIKKNKDKKLIVKNYDKLKKIFEKQKDIKIIENKIIFKSNA